VPLRFSILYSRNLFKALTPPAATAIPIALVVVPTPNTAAAAGAATALLLYHSIHCYMPPTYVKSWSIPSSLHTDNLYKYFSQI